MTTQQQLDALKKTGMVFFDESSFASENDIPQLGSCGVIRSVRFRPDGHFSCYLESDGFFFRVDDDDLTDNEKRFVVEEAYAFRFGLS